MNNHRIGAFDGLRAVAVMLVVSGHCFDSYHSVATSVPAWFKEIFGNASFGVRLFFVLSGYLITALLMREKAQTGSISLGKFYLRRTLRIFPAFYTYISVIALITWLTPLEITPSQFLAAATYTWNYGGLWVIDGTKEGTWFLGHLWTLALEEQFYLVWPFVFVFWRFKGLRYLPLLAMVILPLVRVATYFLVPEWRGYLGMMFHTSIDSILIGCGFALWCDCLKKPIPTLWLKRLVPLAVLIPTVASPLLRLQFGGAYAVTIGFTADALCAGAVIVALREGLAAGSFAQFLTFPAMQWLGRLSYSLYLWQQLFLTELNETWTGHFPISPFAALAAACASYYLLEQPVLRLKDRFSRVSLSS